MHRSEPPNVLRDGARLRPLLQDSANPGGICHVETTNLDGETNLKARRSRAVALAFVAPAAPDGGSHSPASVPEPEETSRPAALGSPPATPRIPPQVKAAPDAAHRALRPAAGDPAAVAAALRGASVLCDPPNRDLYSLTGKLSLGGGAGEPAAPLAPANAVLRGCSLRNTAWVYGCAPAPPAH